MRMLLRATRRLAKQGHVRERDLTRAYTANATVRQPKQKEGEGVCTFKNSGIIFWPTVAVVSLSSCPENTVLTGLNYLKGQPPVLALRDEEYPSWLWSLLKPKVYTDTGPGSKGEKALLRKANRQKIKEQNFLRTQ